MSVCISPALVSAWNLDAELQKELDAISVRSHFSSSSSSADDFPRRTQSSGVPRPFLNNSSLLPATVLSDFATITEHTLRSQQSTNCCASELSRRFVEQLKPSFILISTILETWDDESETKSEALSVVATNAKLDMLINGWREKEKKLQEYEQSLKKIRIWHGELEENTVEELIGTGLESIPRHHANPVTPSQAGPAVECLSVGTSKIRREDPYESNTKCQIDLKQTFDLTMEVTQNVRRIPDFIIHLGTTPVGSPRKVSSRGFNASSQDPAEDEGDSKSTRAYQETRGGKRTVLTECNSPESESEGDPLVILRTRRTNMLEEFRVAELQRATELDQKRTAENEESERRIALAVERRQELEEEWQNEQKKKLDSLEMKQNLKMRWFEELQRKEEVKLESEKQEMETRYKVLANLSETYKHLEEEQEMRRVDEDETVKAMLSQAIRLQEQGSTRAEVAAKSRLFDSCTRIQALIRGYLCRKKHKYLRSDTYGIQQQEKVSAEKPVLGRQDFSFCIACSEVSEPTAKSTEGVSGNRQSIEEVLKKLTTAAETGSVDEIYSCLELAKSIGLDEEARVVEDRLHQRQENMQNWLTQVINGWDTGRNNLQKQFQEANRLELAPMYAVAEAVVFAREKEITESLEMAIARASRWDFYHWLYKAKIMGMEDVIRNSKQGFCRRIKGVKESLDKQMKLGTRDQYTVCLQDATALCLSSDTRKAIKAILKRVLLFVRRAIVLVGAKSNKHNPRAQDWKAVEIEGAQIGLDLQLIEHLRQSICRSRALECVKRVWITNYKVNGTGMPCELINKKHGSVAGWDNTLVYPLTDTEFEQPVVSDGTRRSRPPVHDLISDTPHSLDLKMQQGGKLWVMPHDWLEMQRLQSLWQQHMISERTSGLFSRSGSQEAHKLSAECVSNHTAKMRDSAASPFLTGNFQETFTVEQLREKRKETLHSERQWTLEEEDEYDGDDYDQGPEGLAGGGHKDRKQDLHGADLVDHRVTTNPRKSCLTREILQQKYNFDRKELRWVMTVDLINEGLTSLGRKGIFRWCPRLRSLSVDMNRLTTFKQVFDGGEECLEQLSARDNLLEDFTGLEGLQRLTVLHLDGNLLTQLTPDKIHTGEIGCTKNASNTGRDHPELLPDRFSQVRWSRLQVLTLSCNRLTSVSQLGSLCPNLEVLDLGSNQLVSLGKGEKNALAGLQHLRVLDVGQNKLKSRSLWEGLKHCPELVSLVASRNHLTQLPNHFGSALLREIWLNGNAIEKLGCKVWLPSLQRLYLQDNLITSLEPLWGCPALEVLDLSFNCISECSQLQHLSGFPNLRSLQLNDNPISEKEDHADYILQAVPWLQELDNEAVSKSSRDKAISTLIKNMMEVAGVTFVKEKLSRGDVLLRGFTNPCSAHKMSFNKREHNENRHGQFLNRNVWEVNDVLNGEADEETLWALFLEAKELAFSSVAFQSLLTMNAELIKLGSVRVLSEAEFEARRTMTAHQQMAHRLKGKLHAATKEKCFRVSRDPNISGQHTYQSEGPSHLGPESSSSGLSVSSDRSGPSHLEWCLEEHATFDPRAYTEIYMENTDYRLEAEAQIRRVIKLQALARAHMARQRVRSLMKERKEKRERQMNSSIARVQALWRGWSIRKQNVLEYLRVEELERKLQRSAAVSIQAIWRGYITRMKFQQALRKAKYTDDDDFDYVRIDDNDFLAGELALASYQPADMYLYAVGGDCKKVLDIPAVGNCAIQQNTPELHGLEEERQQALGNIPHASPSFTFDIPEKPKIEKTNTISETLPISSSKATNQRETGKITKPTAQIPPALITNTVKKSVVDNATNFSPRTSLPTGINNTHRTTGGSDTDSTETAVTRMTAATVREDVTRTFPTDPAAEEHDLPEGVKSLDQQSLDDLLKSMGFASPFPSGTRSVELGPRETPDANALTITNKRLDRLMSSSLDIENQSVTERADSQAGEAKRKALSEDKKAAMEEIAKDWGFKNARTAEAYLRARERTLKQAKNVAHQQNLRDPEARFKRFKAKLGGPVPTVNSEERVNDFKKPLRERVCDGGFLNSRALPASNLKAAVPQDLKQQKKLCSIVDVPTDTELAEVKVAYTKKDSVRKDVRRASTNSAQGDLSPWHIPKLNLNSSLDAFLIRDAHDSRR